MSALNKDKTLAQLPAEWPIDLLPAIRDAITQSGRKLVILDDDPTGTQTVHDIPVLTHWTVDALAAELVDPAPAVYVLTNSRSMSLPEAQALNTDIGKNLLAASRQTGHAFAVVSRSDSTLRGHYPGETDALAAVLGAGVDATLIIPFFLEGGRYTIDNVHYVAEGDLLVPAAETPFARDAVFGYRHSDLRQWVAEKSAGRVAASSVAAITLDDLRRGGPTAVTEKLGALSGGTVCIVNAASMRDLQVFVLGLLAAEAWGKQFVYRTAASFVQVRAGLAGRPLLTPADLGLTSATTNQPGALIVVGSYVPKTTGQLSALLAQPSVLPLEVNVDALLDDTQQNATIAAVIAQAEDGLRAGKNVVIYTSRQLVKRDDAMSNLAIGQRVSASLVTIVQKIGVRPRYLIAKGGITSSDIATKALGVQRALVRGQILPGVPLWQLGAESRHPGLAYVVFPGNVGDEQALATLLQRFM